MDCYVSDTVSINKAETPEDGDEGLFNINKAERNPNSAIVVESLDNAITLKMELDTGASCQRRCEKRPSEDKNYLRVMSC